MKTVLAWAAYPLIVGGGMVAAVIALERGIEMTPVIIATGAGALIIIAVLERVIPHVPAWNRSHGDVTHDVLHFVVSNSASIQAINLFGLAALAHVATQIHITSIWPREWPLAAQALLAFVVGEFGVYWAHRIMHTRALLWRVHELHHSAQRMYFLNGFRNHPLDAPFQYAAIMAPVVVLGAGTDIIALIAIYQGIHTPLQHSNIAVKTGPLSYLLATAELHRWHHAREAPAQSANYGTNLILWDHVFGTFRKPPRECVEVGLDGDRSYPNTYVGQVLRPFKG
jgi:ornithine lipid hydroxylase